VIDLRSDTVTRPTEGMRKAMAAADVGDDVYGEDPTVRQLEERVAELFGFEAALFTVTGSLANLLAVRALVSPGEELVCESQAHLVRAELGAHAAMSGVTTRTWYDPNGYPDIATLERLIAPDMGPFMVATRCLSVENTHNFAGGKVQPLDRLKAVRALADQRGITVHVDGARIWNAHVRSGTSLADLMACADTAGVCLSKGMGAPVGSLMLGTADQVEEARVWRKRWGAGWRQAGVLAAAGLYAVDHHIERLADDHRHARLMAELAGLDPDAVETNMVIVETANLPAFVEHCEAEGVLVGDIGATLVRAVTHLDVSEDDARRAGAVLAAASAAYPA
jgi:threonine aldolase